jgi:PAS domain S-box-containing protein
MTHGFVDRTPAVVDRLPAEELYRAHERSIFEQTDRLFAGLMVVQWMAAIAAAYWISPRTWTGTLSQTHLHVWAALYLGGLITLLPVALALTRPGRPLTRYVIATCQVLMSTLLIHFTGGRIETHFHVFASLVFLSFYREWRVLVPATIVVAADHFIRGVFWPQSVFGVVSASDWRWLEHAGWVLFENAFLVSACLRSKKEMWNIAERTAALHASEERYRGIVARAEGIFLAEASTGRLLECNAAFLAMLGYETDEMQGLTLHDVDAGKREDVDRLMRDLLGGTAPMIVERRFRRKDDSIVQVMLTLSGLVSGDGHTLCGAVRDVTEHRQTEKALRRTEEQLRQAHKMDAVGQLAGGIAHDFNNLLTAILGYAEVLSDKLGPGHPQQREAEQIARAGRTAASLTRQLLAFSRRQLLQPAVLDLNGVISNVQKMLRRLIGEHIDLVIKQAPDLPRVRVDAGQLEQVVLNLAVNARDAMREGGRLTIETAPLDLTDDNEYELPAGRCVMLRVTDTGCGMTAAVQAHLFEPFFTTKAPGKGTGLGLSTVYGIVKQSGGAIAVDTAPGKGATFLIVLPAAAGTEEKGAATLARPVTKRTETVLLVEDEAQVRELAAIALERAGFTVLEAQHPEEAFDVVARHQGPIHLILTDVVMPGMNGRVMVERLVGRYPDARILFMSGYTDDALAPLGVAAGDTAFLHKPFTPNQLAERVREVIDAPFAPLRTLSHLSHLI